tara:strand:+ start:3955 stop:4173 length:219 start_codon:yes stop_codon:yes gene_type:complete
MATRELIATPAAHRDRPNRDRLVRPVTDYTIGVVFPREAHVMPRKPGSQMMRTFDGWMVGENLVGFDGGEDE